MHISKLNSSHRENNWGTKFEPMAPGVKAIQEGPEFNYSWSLPQTAEGILMCGVCERPAAMHRDHDSFEFREFCDREYTEWEISESLDDYYWHASGVTPAYDYTGPGTKDFTTELELESVLDLDAIERWVDKFPVTFTKTPIPNTEPQKFKYELLSGECTSATSYWYYDSEGTKFTYPYSPNHKQFHGLQPSEKQLLDTEVRSAFVENIGGFLAKKLLDPELTEKFHRRLLNLWVNKQGELACGLVNIKATGEFVTATCFHGDCYRKNDFGDYQRTSITVSQTGLTETEMEDFVYSIIAHGNNHGPAWFTQRETFYELPAVLPAPPLHTQLTDVEFVMEHQLYCNDSNCGCYEWLANELPTLRKEFAA